MNKLIIAVVIILVAVGGFFAWRYVSGKKADTSPTPSVAVSGTPMPTPENLPEKVSVGLVTARGTIELELYPKVAPVTVLNFITLAKSGFYNGTKFHRVVSDFVIQGGDPLSKTNDPRVGSGGPGYSFQDEINPKILGVSDADIKKLEATGYKYDFNLKSLPVAVGAIAMANSGPNTNGSQFFIVTNKDQPYLNGKHTAFGKVTKGLDIANKVQQGDVLKEVVIR